jgi:translocation and assembly module TamB
MSTSNEVPGGRRSRRRWLLWLVLAVAAIPLVLFAALPWIVGTPFAKRRIEAVANEILAPGGVAFDRVRVSWFRPTEIDGPTLIDPQGEKIVSAPSGTFSWSLWQILFAKPIVGTLTLHHGAVDIERSTDGTVDLLEALKPILKDKPERTIQVRISDATLRFRQEGLADPFYADKAEIALDLARYPEPITWDLKLARTDEPSGPGTMNIEGHLDAKAVDGPPRNAALAVKGDNWPWRFTLPDLHASGLFTGSLAAQLDDGAVKTEGDAAVLNLAVGGDKLSGDELRQDKIQLGWKVEGRDGSYKADRFTLDAPVATLAADGVFPPAADQQAKVEGRVDLAALAGQLRRTLRLQDDLKLDKGAVEILAEAKARSDEEAKTRGAGQRINVTAKLAELAATKGGRAITWNDPATLVARLDRSADSLSLDQLDVQTPFLTASGQGDVDRGIDVNATFDLAAVRDRLRDWVDLGKVETAGQGTLHARYRREKAAYQLAADAEVKGLMLGGLPVVETVRRDAIRGDLAVRGAAEASGIPRDWQYVSLLGKSGVDELKIESTADAAKPTPATIKASGRTELTFNGSKKIIKAGGDVRSNGDVIDLAGLSLSIEPFVGPGGKFLPEPPMVWNGGGRYDRKKDELIVEARQADDGQAVKTFAIAPQKLSAGGFRSKGAAWFEANLTGDLAAVQEQAGLGDGSVGGRLAGIVQGRQNQDAWDLGFRVQGRELARQPAEPDAPLQEIGEVEVQARATLATKAKRLELAELAVVTPYVRAEGAGTIHKLGDTPEVDLKGNVSPDWDGLTKMLASKVEPNASISGRASPWRLVGTLPLSGSKDGEIPDTLDGEVGLHVDQVDVFGMRLQETKIVVRVQEGQIFIDPIDSTLNTGRLHLDPELVVDKKGGRWLRLGRSSSLIDAEINDEVSHRVLSFVAPVLDQATRVKGRISLDLVSANVPLGGEDAQAKIEGDVQFDNVEFMPGPLVDELIGVFRLERRPLLVLRDPISVRILGRKIYQEGLILPVGNVAVIGVDGWVDFNKNLDLLASFAIIPPKQNIPVLSQILESTQLQVPITGTLDKPKIDGEKIKDRFKNLGDALLETTLGIGAGGLGRIFQGGARPRPERDLFPPFPNPEDDDPARVQDPKSKPKPAPERDAAPQNPPFPGLRLPGPLTPEQRQLQREARQQRRVEKRAERRARRGLPPD